MHALIATESRGNPYAINVNDGPRLQNQPADAATAVATAKALLARGLSIDLGLGQINSANLRWLDLSVEQAFDPCRNLSAAAVILASNYQRAVAARATSPLGAALSAYNTGSLVRGYTNGYVARVFRAASALPPALAASGDEAAAPETPPVPAWDVFARAATAHNALAIAGKD